PPIIPPTTDVDKIKIYKPQRKPRYKPVIVPPSPRRTTSVVQRPKIKERVLNDETDFDEIFSSLKEKHIHYEFQDTKAPEYGSRKITDFELPPKLLTILRQDGIERLYKFQQDAYDLIVDGSDVVIEAPTGQGKTEAFALPIIKILSENPNRITKAGIQAVFLYPTKALERDQKQKISKWCKSVGLTVGIYDGDVDSDEKSEVCYNPPDILISNPDTIHRHLGDMTHTSGLSPILGNVRFIVIDEIHQYTGFMGANVYYILKRMQLEVSEQIQIIGSSATISNPKKFASDLFGRKTNLVRSKTAKKGPAHVLTFYPERRALNTMISDIVENLIQNGFHPLVFADSHSAAKNIDYKLKTKGVNSALHYSGIHPEDRKQIEKDYRNGELDVLVATPTLELGMDIGHVTSVVSMLVNPTRLLQRFGRAGRKGQTSVLVVALRKKCPISQFYRSSPEKILGDIDSAFLETDNEFVVDHQTIAAALSNNLYLSSIPEMEPKIMELAKGHLISIDNDSRIIVKNRKKLIEKLKRYNIRGIGDTVELRKGKQIIGPRSMPMALLEWHRGAINLHNRKYHISESLSDETGKWIAQLRPLPYKRGRKRTYAKFSLQPELLKPFEEKKVFGIKVGYYKIHIEHTVTGYSLPDYPKKTSKQYDLDIPVTYSYPTLGIVFKLPKPNMPSQSKSDTDFKNDSDRITAAYHALEHAIVGSSGIFTGGEQGEISGICVGDSGHLVLFDSSPGGTGASKLLYDKLPEVFERAHKILSSCECTKIEGCPNCTMVVPRCSKYNSLLYKKGAITCIEQILNLEETSFEGIPIGNFELIV
ncbi:MAG: DEAD/DEAH box helicase, partial [Candidatus Thorarchaeota archaeon]